MKNMTLRAIAAACGGTLYYNRSDVADTVEADCVVLDSREITKNGVFIATVGERVDGHSFIPAVFEAGALGVVCEKLPEEEYGPCILVKDSFKALSDIAAYYRSRLNCRVIGITGSVGKTSTKEFIASVLSERYRVCKTKGNFNNEVGMPLTILRAREEDDVLVLEMGISHFGEMERMSAIARPDMAVITNIANCHTEFLQDRDGVLQAKTAIFTGMRPGSTVFLNGDDDKLATVSEARGISPVFYGYGRNRTDFNYYVDKYVTRGLFGSDAIIVSRMTGEMIPVSIKLPGEHMLYNALVASALGERLGLIPSQIAAGIENVAATAGRGFIIRGNRYTVIDDCYNANPSAMKSSLKLLSLADTRRVAILGDMFELGENAPRLHREVGNAAGRTDIDVIICVGELSHSTYKGVLDELGENMTSLEYDGDMNKKPKYEGVRLIYFKNKADLMGQLPSILHKDDSVLVKASHGMGFAQIVDWLKDGGEYAG